MSATATCGAPGVRLPSKTAKSPVLPGLLAQDRANRPKPMMLACACPRLAPDDVVNLQHLWFAGIDPNLGQHGHEPLAECVELLPGVPDLADAKVALGTEADVVVESVGWEVTGFLELADAFVVLRGGQGCGSKADENAHRVPPGSDSG